MRLIHPETLRTVAMICADEDFNSATVSRKTVISHAWSEVFKYLATRQDHPKMWLSDVQLGVYLRIVKTYGNIIGCKLNEQLVERYEDVKEGFYVFENLNGSLQNVHANNDSYRFDETYLFSDVVSLYFKGLNIAQYIYGDDWRRVIPIENLSEIYRVVDKAIMKGKLK